MKNIYEILKEYGLEVPEDKKADFDKAWKDNYRTISDYDKVVSQRDNYKTSLDDVSAQLEEFKDVDVKDLQGQITKLQGDLKAKDDEYAAKEADRMFMDSVKEAVKTALENVKKSDGYLFGVDEPINNPVGGTGGNGGADIGGDDVAALRAAMGLPEKK